MSLSLHRSIHARISAPAASAKDTPRSLTILRRVVSCRAFREPQFRRLTNSPTMPVNRPAELVIVAALITRAFMTAADCGIQISHLLAEEGERERERSALLYDNVRGEWKRGGSALGNAPASLRGPWPEPVRTAKKKQVGARASEKIWTCSLSLKRSTRDSSYFRRRRNRREKRRPRTLAACVVRWDYTLRCSFLGTHVWVRFQKFAFRITPLGFYSKVLYCILKSILIEQDVY